LSSTEDRYVKDNLNIDFLKTSSALNEATLNSIIPATIQENPIYYLASDKSKNILLKILQRCRPPSLIPLTQAHVRILTRAVLYQTQAVMQTDTDGKAKYRH
jgi:hypothetical protein